MTPRNSIHIREPSAARKSSNVVEEQMAMPTEYETNLSTHGRWIGWITSSWRWIQALWNCFWTDTTNDLRTIPWRQSLEFIDFYLVPPGVFLVSMALIVLFAARPPINDYTLCLPDGSDAFKSSTQYNPWAASETFTINMGFGTYSFGQAKFIDIVWDIIVGRGGQALMAKISYRSVTSALSRLMEARSVSYATFEAVGIQDTSIASTARMIRESLRHKDRRSRLIFSGIVVCAVCSLAFSTLAGAMTGYMPHFDGGVALTNGTIADPKVFQRVWYVIQDGSRLGPGFYDNYPVVDYSNLPLDYYSGDPYARGTSWYATEEFDDTPDSVEKSRDDWMFECGQLAPGETKTVSGDTTITLQDVDDSENDDGCDLFWQVSRYTHTYGLLGMKNTSSWFYDSATKQNITVPAPVLNVTMFVPDVFLYYQPEIRTLFRDYDLAWAIMPYGYSWYLDRNYTTGHEEEPDAAWFVTSWLALNTGSESVLMTEDLVLRNISCRQQTQGIDPTIQYQWGFGLIPLVWWLILMWIWTGALYVLNIDTMLHSRILRAHRKLGLRRCILDLAPKYQAAVDEKDDVWWISDENLQDLLDKGQISYEDHVSTKHPKTGRERLSIWWVNFTFKRWVKDVKSWARGEWAWLGVLCVCLLLWALAPSSPDGLDWAIDLTFGWLLWSGAALVLVAGRNHPSRWIIFVAFAALFFGLHFGLIDSITI